MPAEPDLDKQAQAGPKGSPPPEAVLAALEQVVGGPAFSKAQRPARFLRYLVDATLRGDRRLLKESVLGTDVFDRPASWDPRLDPVVRQEAARLRKRLARHYETEGKEAEIRIELPVGSYVPVFLRKPEVVESAPAQTQPAEAHSAAPAPAPVKTRRIWQYCAAAILLSAAAGFLTWRAVARHDPPSIVVLPFTDSSADPSSQYFSDGLTDEITDSLARLKTLRVIARSSAFQFKGKAINIPEVGRLLHVANILEGSVDRSGSRIRIIAHLERVSDSSLIWSNTYESSNSDLFALQSELAASIVASLNAAAGVPPSGHIPNAEAHDSVLKARYDLQRMTTESLTSAEAEYQHAIDLDPAYGAAYAGLASAKYDQYIARGSSFQTEAERKSAEQLFHKALELDPNQPIAHVLLAVFALQFDWDWGRAERELRLSIAGQPNVNAESFYAMLLVFRGRFAEADEHLRRTIDLDPFSTSTLNNLAVARGLEGRFAQAREVCQQIAAQYPNMLAAQELIGETYLVDGHPDQALPIFSALKQRYPAAQVFEAMAYAKSGRRDEALRLIRPFEDKYPDSGVSMLWLAEVYSFLGDQPNALKWLERSLDRHEWQALSIAVHPAFAAMRNTPGFQALEKRVGLPW